MSNTAQEYVASKAVSAAEAVIEALNQVPEEKRSWSPGGDARTAIDIAAECALLNGYTAESIRAREISASHLSAYDADKAALIGQGSDAVIAGIRKGALAVADAIRAVPDDALSIEAPTPWGPMTMKEMIGYPYWNMSYHEGQINYIASILGTLK